MGIVQMGPPTEFVLFLKENFGIKKFIETGTYRGNTAIWAAGLFDFVLTVENSKEIFEETYAKYGDSQKVNFVFGDSRLFLEKVVATLSDPALFWLDSHWCGSNSYGETDQCPLLSEIAELNKASAPQFILIDDARLFMAPPPLPNELAYWPAIDQVTDALKKGHHQYYIAIYEDVIIAVPQSTKDAVSGFLQKLTTKAWNEIATTSTDAGILDGIKLMGNGARTMLNKLTSKLFSK
jgi:hypothetical protein